MDSLIDIYTNRNNRYIQKIPLWVYFISFLILYWAAYCVSQIEALDLGRYYDSMQDRALTSSIREIIDVRMYGSKKYDFLYHILLYVAIKLSIPLNLVTTTIVFIYFYSICHILFRISIKKIAYVVIIVVLLTTPLTWTISISRNETAIMFQTIALLCFLNKKKFLGIVFLIISVFTHYGSILYIIIFVASLFLSRIRIRPYLIFLLLALFLVLSFTIPSSIRDIMTMSLDEEGGYTHYFLESSSFVFFSSSIRYGDKLPILYSLFYSTFLLFLNKEQGYAFWVLLISTMFLFFFLNFGLMFVNRIMLLMPLVWGLNIAFVFRNSTSKGISFIHNLSLIGLIPILLHFYAYRASYLIF